MLAGATALKSGYGRGMEDQADRVGLRYAYEAGYDITKGPRLWNRFARKYGEGNKVANFFFSDHSLSAARATKLEKEIAYNYPDGPKPDGPPRQARRATPAAAPTVAVAEAPVPAGAQALSGSGKAGPGTRRTEIKAGMTTDEVRKALGDPEAEVAFGGKTQLDLSRPHRGLREREGRRREVLNPPYFLRATPSSASFAAMSAPAVSTFTSLSMNRIFPSLPM